MDDQVMAYVGRKSCGCIVCAIVDVPNMKKEIAEDLSNWVLDGLTIDRVPVDEVRVAFTADCTHKNNKQLSMFDVIKE